MKTMVCSPKDCTLCMACVNSCPKNAIDLGVDEYGYEKIVIDPEKCVNCGCCENVCFRRNDVLRKEPVFSYAAQSLHRDSLKKSASGGAFQMIAETVLQKGGVCYGCMFSRDGKRFGAKHVRIDSIKDLPLILNSKYVPSIIGNAYQKVREDLNTGKFVLFSGTPCQVQGLKAFLNKDYENLLTVDLICHGVPSTKMFNDYVEQIEKKDNIKIVNYLFRDKSISWGTNFCYSYYKEMDSKKRIYEKHCPREESSYMMNYLRGDIFRENCYTCMLSDTKRVSDFTLGDFWGIEQEYPEYVTHCKPRIALRLGVSCILANTKKAIGFVTEFEEKMILHQVPLESIALHNGNLRGSAKRRGSRDQLMQIYQKHGYAPIENEYRSFVGKKRFIYNVKNFLKSYLPDRVRIFIYNTPILRRIVFH